MTRFLTFIGAMIFCAAFWIVVFIAGVHAYRSLKLLDPQGVLAMLLIAAGLALVITGWITRFTALCLINSRSFGGLQRMASVLLACGVCTMFAGVGSILTIEVAR